MKLLDRFCCWTPIWLDMPLSLVRQGYWRCRNLMAWLIDVLSSHPSLILQNGVLCGKVYILILAFFLSFYPGSMMASWASDNSDDCSSVHSSGATSSDGSFLAEADFASAVAKAAELSGLTVVGSTVTDPNAGKERERERRRHRHRERAKRPSSPYSTDSNYSAVQLPRNPYPKSDRKRQFAEHNGRSGRHNNNGSSGSGDNNGSASLYIGDKRSRPPVKAKPQIPQHGK